MASFLLLAALLALTAAPGARAFYLPGVAPRDYGQGARVELLVNSLASPDTVLPYDQYYPQLHFCEPEKIIAQSESLGSIVFGDRLYNSAFELNVNVNKTCVPLCTKKVPQTDAKFINYKIKEQYAFSWQVDGLPVARLARDRQTRELVYTMGFGLGEVDEKGTPFLHNHYDLHIQYHPQADGFFRVVGAYVMPYSLADPVKDGCNTDKARLALDESKDGEISYTYNVKWELSDTPWATRWDHYLHVFDPKIHWFSLINSIVIVFFLTGMVAMILIRALHKDIVRYNNIDEAQEDAQEEFGWKLVHGDVFRAPARFQLLSVLAGNGVQIFGMAAVSLVFSLLGFLSPSSRGSLSTVMLVFYVLFGGVAGYTSARLYKMFGGENWKRNVFLTAFLLTGFIFTIFIVLNFFLVGANSSGAVPFSTMFALFALWFLVSTPLCCFGAYLGYKRTRIEYPVRTNQIPRQVPDQPLYLRKLPSILLGGILPFGAIFIELYFIMSSIWHHQAYYVFGFLFLVSVVLIITCSEVTILMAYFHLCSEDYNWWWRSFMTSGASAFYVFLYGVLYYFTKLQIDNVPSTILYFGWMFVISFLFFVVTGTIGFLACLLFVKKIYGSIKID